MRQQGKICNWKDEQGFGFISPDKGGNQIFVHIKSFAHRQRRPVGNDIVTYELKTDAKGRTQADHVAFMGERVRPAMLTDDDNPSRPGRGDVALIFAAVFLALVAGAVYADQLPLNILTLYAGASTIAFLTYALDKSAARGGRWRTRESTLHLLALIGGWPGALTAQKLFRHKSKKQAFQTTFWFTVALNCGALGWLLSASGTGFLRFIVGAT